MIKKISTLVFIGLLVASFGLAASASTKPATTSSEHAMASMTKVSGTVDKVDLKTHTVTINTGTETKTVSFGSKTSYLEKGKKVRSSQLKSGQKVDVWTDSKNMAHKIEIEPAASMTH